jgi:hypothetical protein
MSGGGREDTDLEEANRVPETFSTLWLAIPVAGMLGVASFRALRA